MLGYIEGTLIWASPSAVIISAGGLGYEITYFNNFTYSEFGSQRQLFITHKITEYGENLFGFATIEEKLIFENLENIKGVGSKVIYTIMALKEIKSYSELQDIKLDDLVKLPGVGKATAQKFLLALSGKLKKEFELETNSKNSKSSVEDQYKSEIALMAEWGVHKKDLVPFLQENSDTLADMKSDQIIQFILKNMGKK